jgi:glycerophosphoryl diester phosphodiesterase
MAETIRVVARRGDAENAPENTLPAFESAIACGADGIEFDVHQTLDGRLIVHHFYTLGSTDNGVGLVHEKSLSELKALDSGGWFSPQFSGITKPTLAEVLELCRGRIQLEIDLKHSSLDFLHQVIREVELFNLASEVELTTAHIPLLAAIKSCNAQLKTGAFFYAPPEWMPVRLAQQHTLDWASLLKIDTAHLNISLITADFVQRLHEEGFQVYGSNLDTREEIQQGLQLGIDSFSTGKLNMALQIRNESY